MYLFHVTIQLETFAIEGLDLFVNNLQRNKIVIWLDFDTRGLDKIIEKKFRITKQGSTIIYSMVPLSMAIGNVELMHKCVPKHSHMGTGRTARTK